MRDAFASLEEELAAIARHPATSQSLRDATHRLRRTISLFINAEPPTSARVLPLEDALFSGLANLPRGAARLASLRPPAIDDLDPRLLRRFVSPEGIWRIEVMPKPGMGLLSFAAAIRRVVPQAAGEPVAALARNEIIHHETLLALAAAVAAAAILALATLRSLFAWIAAMFPAAAFVTLTAALAASFGLVLNAGMLAAASAAAALLICSGMAMTGSLLARDVTGRLRTGAAMRAGLLPPLVLAGAVAPLALSTRQPIAALGAVMAMMLLLSMLLGMVLVPSLVRWIRRLAGHE